MRVKNVPTEPISAAASDLWQCPVGPVQACQSVAYGTPFAAALIGEDDRLASATYLFYAVVEKTAQARVQYGVELALPADIAVRRLDLRVVAQPLDLPIPCALLRREDHQLFGRDVVLETRQVGSHVNNSFLMDQEADWTRKRRNSKSTGM